MHFCFFGGLLTFGLRLHFALIEPGVFLWFRTEGKATALSDDGHVALRLFFRQTVLHQQSQTVSTLDRSVANGCPAKQANNHQHCDEGLTEGQGLGFFWSNINGEGIGAGVVGCIEHGDNNVGFTGRAEGHRRVQPHPVGVVGGFTVAV